MVPGSLFLVVPAGTMHRQQLARVRDPDAFPVSPGHALIITRRPIATWWEATNDERLDVLELIDWVKLELDDELRPDGYSVGFNAGPAAGPMVQ